MSDPIHALLTVPTLPPPTEDPARWWRGVPATDDATTPLERALLQARSADRPAWATLAGHQAALRALLPTLPQAPLIAFCASEEGGAHPAAITTRLSAVGSSHRLSGEKQWATLAPAADLLVVVASTGRDGERNRLTLVAVPAARAGIEIEAMPPPGFLPELPHGRLRLQSVEVTAEELLPGDGYLDGIKPFRTLEDLYVGAALVSYNLALALRFGWSEAACQELLCLLAAALELSRLDPRSPSCHVALAGWLDLVERQRRRSEAEWRRVDDPIRRAWQRDTGVSLAARARERRRRVAWQKLAAAGSEG